jgi:hypothetical protein
MVYSDVEWDAIMSEDSIETIDIPRPKYDVWRCPVCERLYFFELGKSQAIKTYVLEK